MTPDEKLVRSVEHNLARYKAITTEVAEFPYSANGATVLTYGMWVNALTAMEDLKEPVETIKRLDGLTNGGFSRTMGVFGTTSRCEKVSKDFERVIKGLQRGTIKSELGETVELDRFGYPNIAPYMAGCRESTSVPIDKVDDIDLKTFVAPWHSTEDVPDYDRMEGLSDDVRKKLKSGIRKFFTDTYEDDNGVIVGIIAYGYLYPWDQYRVIANLCAAGFEKAIQGLLGGKAGAKVAAQLEDKAAVILYENITGVMVGYSKACAELDKAFMAEIAKDSPEYQISYKPKPGEWGPTMELTLPRDEIRAWRAAGGTPLQLKELRGAVYTLLKNESTPYWWRRYQVTLTLGQIVRGLYKDADHHLTDNERTLLLASFDLLTKTHVDCTYPPKDKKARHSHIDESKLTIHGLTLFPAIWVEETDANGNVARAAFKFHAMPPLDLQADELNQAYTLPYLSGTSRLPAIKGRIEQSTINVQTALARYIRMAKAEGAATVYIDTLTRETEPFKVDEITTLIQWADSGYVDGEHRDPEECRKEKRRQQQRMRNLRGRVKRDVIRVLPHLIENEATAATPCYLNVDTVEGRRDGFRIERVKSTERQRKEHRSPHTHFNYGKKPL